MHSADLDGDEKLESSFRHTISTFREVYDHVVRMTVELEKEVK